MSVALSASGWGLRPRVVSFSMTIASIGCRASPAARAGRTGGTSAQCGSYAAPSATHRFRVATCSSVSRPIFASGGGMTASGSSDTMRASSSLMAGFSGTIARPPLSSSAVA